MFDLFKKAKLFEIETNNFNNNLVKLAIFTRVNNDYDDKSKIPDYNHTFFQKTFNPAYNLCLYCEDYRFLLFQFDSDGPNEFRRSFDQSNSWRHFLIPLDKSKGSIVSMCWNRNGTKLLAITESSLIYLVPFGSTSFYDPYSDSHRVVLEEDATIIKSCQLKNPTSIVWWQRNTRFVVSRYSIAIVGSESGQISMIDLETDEQFQTYSLSFSIRSLNLYDEMYNTSLLISCHQGFQYQLILEEHRNSLSTTKTSDSTLTTCDLFNNANSNKKPNSSDSLLNNVSNLYLSCLIGQSFETDFPNDCEVYGSNNIGLMKPQLILFDNEIDFNTSLLGNNKAQNVAAQIAAEFFFFNEESTSLSSNDPNISLHPQTVTNNIHVMKYRNLKIKSSPTCSLSTSVSSGPEADHESIDSDDSNDFLMIGSDTSKHSPKSSKSDFCNISLCNDSILEVYEFDSSKFCTKTISLSSGRLFMVSMNNHDNQIDFKADFIRLIDLSYRFLLLVFKDKCFLISKTFAEQTKSTGGSASSPRSPLLLKRSDSTGHRRLTEKIGSFRRKNVSTSQNVVMSVIDEFKPDMVVDANNEDGFENDQIIDVFPVKPCSTHFGIREYLLKNLSACATQNSFNETMTDLDWKDYQEQQLIELLSSSNIDDSTICIDEKFLIVTKRSVYLIESREKSFGKFFHSNIESILVQKTELKETDFENPNDGDIISRAKLLVDCFATNRNTSHHHPSSLSSPSSKDSPIHNSMLIPSQSWQLWLCRSALLLIRSLIQDFRLQRLSEENRFKVLFVEHQREQIIDKKLIKKIDEQMTQVCRLLELSRCSRRRVISAFIYYKFWSKSIQHLQKFFQTRILFELNDEERLHLSWQMFEALLAIYQFYSGLLLMSNNHNSIDYYYQKESENNLYQYFYEYRHYYDPMKLLRKLVNLELLNLAEYLALLSGDYLHLIHFILKKYSPNETLLTLPTEIREKILQILTTNQITNTLIVSTDYLDGCRSISLIERYIQFLFTIISKLELKYLYFLTKVFDPSRISVRFLMNQTLFYCNQTYLQNYYSHSLTQDSFEVESNELHSTGLSSADSELSLITSNGDLRKTLLPIKRRDLLNLHIFLQSIYLKELIKQMKNDKAIYDWSFFQTVTKFIDYHCENYQINMDQQKKKSLVDEKINCQWRLAAGTYCSSAYNNDQFYLWGKFKYTYSYSEQFHQNFLTTSSPIILSNDNSPNFSSQTNRIKTPTLNRFFSSVINSPIQSISIGHHHLMILTEYGLFGLGSSSFGQLGLGSKVLSSPYPSLLNFSSSIKIRKVCCGSYHTLALSYEGHLYSFGWALHGQLGHGFIEDQFQPKLIKYFLDVAKVLIVDMAAGYCHSVALTTNGELYVFGGNANGQLGIEPDLFQDKFGKSKYCLPTKFCLLNVPIQFVCCGLFHTVILTENNFRMKNNEETDEPKQKLYCWGIDPKTWRLKMRSDRTSNASHQSYFRPSSPRYLQRLDSGSSYYQSVWDYAKIREISLEKLSEDCQVIKICAGQSHTLLLTDNGQIYSFGYGREGQLGGTIKSPNLSIQSSDEAQPIIMQAQTVDGLKNIQFVDIACGAVHSLALDCDGNVWGWGQSSQNQLAVTNDYDDSSALQDSEPFDSNINLANKRSTPLSVKSTNQSLPLVNNMILSSPKNNQRMAMIVLSLNRNNNKIQSEKNIISDDFTWLQTPKLLKGEGKHCVEILFRQILLTIIYNRHDLNLKSLIKRFEILNFHQLSSYSAWMLNDYIQSWRFQLEALYQETLQNKTILIEELSKLTSFYMQKIFSKSPFSQSSQSESILEMLKILISFWKRFLEKNSLLEIEKKDFRIILKNVFLEEKLDQKEINPYFGLHLLGLIKTMENEEDLRNLLGLDDQILILIVDRIEKSFRQMDNVPLVTLEEFFDKVLDVKPMFHCSNTDNTDDTDSSDIRPLFPLELKWQQLINSFDKSLNKKPMQSNDVHDEDSGDIDELEICIPSYIEDDNNNNENNNQTELSTPSSSLILIFKCGHYISYNKFNNALTNFFNENENNEKEIKINQSLETNWQSLKFIYKNISSIKPEDFDCWLKDQIKDLVCIDCCLSC